MERGGPCLFFSSGRQASAVSSIQPQGCECFDAGGCVAVEPGLRLESDVEMGRVSVGPLPEGSRCYGVDAKTPQLGASKCCLDCGWASLMCQL